MNTYNWKFVYLPWAIATFIGYGLSVQAQLDDPSIGALLVFSAFLAGVCCGWVRAMLQDEADNEDANRLMRGIHKSLEKHRRRMNKKRRNQQQSSEEDS